MVSRLSPLFTDYYQFTMAYGYWQLGRAEEEAVFQLTFRRNPFKNNYTIACGLANVIEFLKNYRFRKEDINYLANLLNPNNKAVFSEDFLNYLAQLKFSCTVDAIPEGSVVFPQEPLLRIQGPLLQCQLLETPLINLMNLSCLVATRASQICQTVGDDPVMEFGLRRAQGPDGGLTATRAAYIGGCDSTSNVLAGKEYSIPVKGTQAHSWIMSYPDEYSAFSDFVKVIDTTILLVDTYDSMHGIKNAIKVGHDLRKQGRDLMAIRLDSGDLLKLSRKARKMLDQAGFKKTKIIVSGDLDQALLAYLKENRAPIDIWGVGTRLVTAYDQPSLDIIYKLTALKNKSGEWNYKMKLSDQPQKTTLPGILQVRRFYQDKNWLHDTIYDTELKIAEKNPKNSDHYEDLLLPIFKLGKLLYNTPTIQDIRHFCLKQAKEFTSNNRKKYRVNLDKKLVALKDKLIT